MVVSVLVHRLQRQTMFRSIVCLHVVKHRKVTHGVCVDRRREKSRAHRFVFAYTFQAETAGAGRGRYRAKRAVAPARRSSAAVPACVARRVPVRGRGAGCAGAGSALASSAGAPPTQRRVCPAALTRRAAPGPRGSPARAWCAARRAAGSRLKHGVRWRRRSRAGGRSVLEVLACSLHHLRAFGEVSAPSDKISCSCQLVSLALFRRATTRPCCR